MKLTPPTKTQYFVGQSLDLTGGKITLVYSNGESEEISLTNTNVKITGFDSTTESATLAMIQSQDPEAEEQLQAGDYRFEGIYNHPERSLNKLKQYKFLCTPDFSIYSEMDKWRKIDNIAKNRWVGAYWQNRGLIVVPTISWGKPSTFDYCFDGVDEGSIIELYDTNLVAE